MVESADGPNASPGEILRGARELYGWSLDEVAAERAAVVSTRWTDALGPVLIRHLARVAPLTLAARTADGCGQAYHTVVRAEGQVGLLTRRTVVAPLPRAREPAKRARLTP